MEKGKVTELLNGHFQFKVLPDGGYDRNKVICKHCKAELSYHRSFSSLKYHLNAKHTVDITSQISESAICNSELFCCSLLKFSAVTSEVAYLSWLWLRILLVDFFYFSRKCPVSGNKLWFIYSYLFYFIYFIFFKLINTKCVFQISADVKIVCTTNVMALSLIWQQNIEIKYSLHYFWIHSWSLRI